MANAGGQTSADSSSGLKRAEGVSVAEEGGQRAQMSTKCSSGLKKVWWRCGMANAGGQTSADHLSGPKSGGGGVGERTHGVKRA